MNELSDINSIGNNIIQDPKLKPNGLDSNNLHTNVLSPPEIVNSNSINSGEINANKIVSDDKITENIKMNIEKVEPTEVTKELEELGNNKKKKELKENNNIVNQK